jgi:hypothetical protein
MATPTTFFLFTHYFLSCFLSKAATLWCMTNFKNMYVTYFIVLLVEVSYCLSVCNVFIVILWWLTLIVPKVVKLQTKYLFAKRSCYLFLFCFFPCLVVFLGLAVRLFFVWKLVQGLYGFIYKLVFLYIIICFALS